MEPTYVPYDVVYVNRLAYLFRKPKIGDIVVIKDSPRQVQDKHLIKRISNISKQGYSLVGDNKNRSTDSRHFGPIKKRNITGRVICPLINN